MQEQDIRRLAAEASVDPRTVKKLLDGGEIRKLVEERIRTAAKRLRLSVK
jgi:hypothetical protein